jgi:hypothetical protein
MMIEFPENGLAAEELPESVKFFDRLCPDKKNIETVIGLVDGVANKYFSSDQHNENRHAFCRRKENGKGHEHGYAFFAVYAIGGNITKEGERPDLDLLVVTNAWWDSRDMSHSPVNYVLVDPVVFSLINQFGEKNVKIHGKLPNAYHLGASEGKALLTITPEAGKKIDLSYVRSYQGAVRRCCSQEEVGNCSFISEDEFTKLDVDKSGNPLPRVLLYRKRKSVFFGGQIDLWD